MRTLSFVAIFMIFTAPTLWADTIVLKDGTQIKGLVVEEHADRIIVSTEKGEVPYLRNDFDKINYDDPAQNFYQVGKTNEDAGKLAEALAFYERALEINPNLQEAHSGAVRARSRYWAKAMQGPQSEIDKQEMLHGGWQKSNSTDTVKGIHQELKSQYGLVLSRAGDWVIVSQAMSGKSAGFAGLKSFDRLVMLEGQSLRYLTIDVTARKILSETARPFTITVERDTALKTDSNASLKNLGLDLNLEYQGLIVKAVDESSISDAAGLREGDLLIAVNGEKTRYMPIAKAKKLIENGSAAGVKLSIQRPFMITSA